jgi:hypothetical protein
MMGVAGRSATTTMRRSRSGRRRQQLAREVGRQVRLASAPHTKAGQERPIHQGLRGNAGKRQREKDDDLPRVELRERLPHFFLVDELRQKPAEDDPERRDHKRGSEQAPPHRPRHRCRSREAHESLMHSDFAVGRLTTREAEANARNLSASSRTPFGYGVTADVRRRKDAVGYRRPARPLPQARTRSRAARSRAGIPS